MSSMIWRTQTYNLNIEAVEGIALLGYQSYVT
jgi:hypothetical protein